VELDWSIVGGFLTGAIAGGAARYGRLCTMSAIEDALVGGDFRGAKAWLGAVLVAATATSALSWVGLVDVGASHYAAARVHLLGLVLGGLLFGLGMTLVGTCSFGLVVRAASGDLRAAMSGFVVGVLAFAVTTGVLAPVRAILLDVGVVDLGRFGGATLSTILPPFLGSHATAALLLVSLVAGTALVLADKRLRQRPRLLAAAVAMGLAVAGGWVATTAAVDSLSATRVESLSFVAPLGRLLLQAMAMPFRGVGFGVAAVAGAALASFAVAAARREVRWEAYDDPIEMRRHIGGAALMGVGGVLAQGCTIGQGLSAASVLAVSAPVFVVSLVAGAHIGLRYLIEGTAIWRLGFSPRTDR
jgi:uncharacterized membrane protein YedE/YeeE